MALKAYKVLLGYKVLRVTLALKVLKAPKEILEIKAQLVQMVLMDLRVL